MRDNAEDSNLPQRIDDPGDAAVSASPAASASASASDGKLPGRISGPCRHDLSDTAATSATAAAGAQVRRTRLNLLGAGANCAGLIPCEGL